MPENELRKFEGEITIDDLYPDLSPEKQAAAEYRMLRYLAVVKEIFEQICREDTELLTELERRAMLRKKNQDKK